MSRLPCNLNRETPCILPAIIDIINANFPLTNFTFQISIISINHDSLNVENKCNLGILYISVFQWPEIKNTFRVVNPLYYIKGYLN